MEMSVHRPSLLYFKKRIQKLQIGRYFYYEQLEAGNSSLDKKNAILISKKKKLSTKSNFIIFSRDNGKFSRYSRFPNIISYQ